MTDTNDGEMKFTSDTIVNSLNLCLSPMLKAFMSGTIFSRCNSRLSPLLTVSIHVWHQCDHQCDKGRVEDPTIISYDSLVAGSAAFAETVAAAASDSCFPKIGFGHCFLPSKRNVFLSTNLFLRTKNHTEARK